ncbi:MAG: glycerol-3-phosphate 1-O-acyltransferase PlsY [Candidatus Omnitrophota bacterium]
MLPAGIIISYLLGSIPTAYIFGRIIKGIDIRDFGSGNVGATNVFRVLGPAWGIIVLILDILKGIIPVTALADYFIGYTEISPEILRIVFGFACVCGHNWTLFLRFRGGKGVATTLGVLIGLATAVAELRLILLLVILVWLAVFLILRFVSVASVASALSFPVFVFVFHRSKELLALGIALAILIVLRHKKNLLNLLHGKERPLSLK